MTMPVEGTSASPPEGRIAQDDRGARRSLSVDRSSRPHYKEGIRLAEMGKWATLIGRLDKEPHLARHKDHHGMLPLHWACTEDDVPSTVVKALLQASPEAVLTKNNAQLLPIHIAVRAQANIETLRLLCNARPSSLLEETPSGKTALMLAQEVNLPKESMEVLRKAEQEYLALDADTDTLALEVTKREIALQSQRLRESMLLAPPTRAQQTVSNASSDPLSRGHALSNVSYAQNDSLVGSSFGAGGGSFGPLSVVDHNGAPKFMITEDAELPTPTESTQPKSSSSTLPGPPLSSVTQRFDDNQFAPSICDNDHNSGVCGVCYKKFSMFRSKYQCKGCSVFLCKKHVAGKIQLPNYIKKRSVCGDCYRIYRNGPMPITMPGTAPATAPMFSNRTHLGTSSSTSSQFNVDTGGAGTNSLRSLNSFTSSNTTTIGTIGRTRTVRSESTHSTLGRRSMVSGPQLAVRYSTASGPTRPRHHNSTGFGGGSGSSVRNSGVMDRVGSDTTVSLTDSDRGVAAAAELAALNHRIATLEEHNKILMTRVADQERQYNEAMLLLTETMTRVAEIEIRQPKNSGMDNTSTTSGDRASDAEDVPYSFPSPFLQKFD